MFDLKALTIICDALHTHCEALEESTKTIERKELKTAKQLELIEALTVLQSATKKRDVAANFTP